MRTDKQCMNSDKNHIVLTEISGSEINNECIACNAQIKLNYEERN